MDFLLKPRNYYKKKKEEVLEDLKTSSEGLSDFEAQGRLDVVGENRLPKGEKLSSLKLLLKQLNSPLIFIIVVAAIFSYIADHAVDAIFILVVVLINTVVGYFQEKKAEKALEKLEESVKFYCQVIRKGKKKRILNEFLVPGDIVELKTGDKVPADGRLIFSNGLKINEASLTGEWLSIKKDTEEIEGDKVVSDRSNMVFMGTAVEEGRGIFVVTSTGIRTEVGKISDMVKQEKETKTPMQKKFIQISRFLSIFILAAIALFSIIYTVRGVDPYTIFITSIALVVSAIPEGLLPAVTVILVLGMRRLAKKNALVRKLNATEGMGSVSTICMDKTGTLTKGEMQVSHILAGSEGALKINDLSEDEKLKEHSKALEIGMMIQNAYVENYNDELKDWIIQGSPTEKALLVAGINAGIDKEEAESELEIIKEIEFDSSRKYATKSYKRKSDGSSFTYVMGAPEIIISMSNSIDFENKKLPMGSDESRSLSEKLDEFTNKGLRLVACAYKDSSSDEEDLSDLILVGYIALKDPVRENVASSLEMARKAGIRPIIITGDHKNTARAIVEELGVKVNYSEILEGADLDEMNDNELESVVEKVSIFARVVPEHKIKIVRALQKRGQVVAMVGDGMNDAPAIKAADIGISVGSGTDITKEVADIVLIDNSFSVIISAIEQGRLIKDNIRRVLVYLLADNFSILFLFFTIVFFGLPFPLYPIQILWINLVEDSFPNIALTTEKDVTGLMDKKVDPKEPLLGGGYKKFMLAVFLISGVTAFATFFLALNIFGDLEKARTITFILVAFDSLMFAFIAKTLRVSVFSWKTFSNWALNMSIVVSLLILLIGIYFPPAQSLLKTVPVALSSWGIVIGIAFVEFILLEASKRRFIS